MTTGVTQVSGVVAVSYAIPVFYTDGTSQVEQRNGTTPQANYLYNTYTDSSNYERSFWRWNSNTLQFGTEASGTGTLRSISVLAGTVGLTITNAGGGVARVSPSSNNAVDLGTAILRYRTIYGTVLNLASQVSTATSITLTTLSPYRTICNNAAAVAVSLPASPVDGETRVVTNVGAGVVTVSYTGRTGATTKTIAQDSAVTFAYSSTLSYWTLE